MLDRAPRDRPIEDWELPVRRFSKRILSALNASVYRLTDGQVAGTIPGGAPLLLLERTSSRTGKVRTATLLYVTDPDNADRYIVAGSSGGAPTDPDWITHLEKGSLEIRVQSEKYPVKAMVRTEGRKYDRYWNLLAGRYHFFDDYKARVEEQFRTAENTDQAGKVRKVIPIAVLQKQPTTGTGGAS